jgi:hypothetical protein
MGEARLRNLPAAVLLTLLGAAGFAAAAGSGGVDGQVLDAQGKSLQGTSVTLLEASSKATQSQTSDAEGKFHFDGLSSGVYIVTAAMDGYAPVNCPGVRILSGLTRHLDLKLAAASAGQPSSCAVASPGK